MGRERLMTVRGMTDLDELVGSDMLSVEDLTGRLEYLEDDDDPDAVAEVARIADALDDLRGYGGDYQWRGDWYPDYLVLDSYFTEYARELAEDIGAIPADASWPAYCIDWDWAARELRMDYSSVVVAGVEYWYR